MVDQYLTRELLRKNRGVYFKKGKWLLHLFFIILFWSALTIRIDSNKPEVVSFMPVASLLSTLSFISFFYFYCLYLIPFCFKRNQFRRFWVLLIASLLLFPLADAVMKLLLSPYFPVIKPEELQMTPIRLMLYTCKTFAGSFMSFTAMLFFMELLEGIRTSRETEQHSTRLMATEKQLIRTRMDPEFITRSLDGITRLSGEKSDAAPDAVVRFSDILRYRLYRSAGGAVLLEEELQQLGNLIRFHNAIHGADAFCTLETEGETAQKYLPPLSLINIAEPLLNLYTSGAGWSLLIYLLVEEKELQIAVELTTFHPQLPQVTETLKNNLISIFGTAAVLIMETDGAANSIRICLPIQNNSIALS